MRRKPCRSQSVFVLWTSQISECLLLVKSSQVIVHPHDISTLRVPALTQVIVRTQNIFLASFCDHRQVILPTSHCFCPRSISTLCSWAFHTRLGSPRFSRTSVPYLRKLFIYSRGLLHPLFHYNLSFLPEVIRPFGPGVSACLQQQIRSCSS